MTAADNMRYTQLSAIAQFGSGVVAETATTEGVLLISLEQLVS